MSLLDMTFENMESKEYLEEFNKLQPIQQEAAIGAFSKKSNIAKKVIRSALNQRSAEFWPPEIKAESKGAKGGCKREAALFDNIALQILDGHQIRTVLESGTILQYKNGGWTELKPREIGVMAQTLTGKTGLTTSVVKEVIGRIERENLISIADFERRPDLLMDANGNVFNVLTRKFEEVTAKDVTVIHKIGAVFNPKIAVPDEFLRVMELVIPDPIERMTLQEHIGSALYRVMLYDKAIIIYGLTRNGKTTIMDTFQCVIGEPNTATISLQDIGKPFRLFTLWRKLYNFVDDILPDAVRNTSTFKILHGGAKQITIEQKYHDPFQANIYTKSVYGANLFPPAANKDDDGYYSKIIIIHAPNRFLLDSEIGKDGLQDGEYNADPDLVERLTSNPDNLSGILNWMLEGLQRLNEQKCYSKKLTLEEGKAECIALAAPEGTLGVFIRAFCDTDRVSMIRKKDLLTMYKEYCQIKKIPSPSNHEFNKTLLILGYNPKYRIEGYNAESIYGDESKSPELIMGFKFKDEWQTILNNLQQITDGLEPIAAPVNPFLRSGQSKQIKAAQTLLIPRHK